MMNDNFVESHWIYDVHKQKRSEHTHTENWEKNNAFTY